MVTDVVCGMHIDETKATEKSEYNGKTYCFCSSSCKSAFEKEPKKYAERKESGSEHQHHH
ncbi:MAG: YHS domain-containing protein [Bacteroidota bacterium]|nr:YHS domain-containing protein [Bacteroidota bacterium]